MNVVFFLLRDSPTPEFYVPTFRKTLSVPSSRVVRTRKIIVVSHSVTSGNVRGIPLILADVFGNS